MSASWTPELRRQLVQIVGDDGLDDRSATLTRYGASLTGQSVTPLCVVFPRTCHAVAALVKLASAEKLVLHAISRGKNFGYGDAQGTQTGQVIVDLSRMDRVVEIDDALCVVRVEPGVSQGQLSDALARAPGRGLLLDVTGAGREASVVGNILERGFGHTEYGDRFARVVQLTVVLPDGTIVRTGMGAYSECNSEKVYRHGVGPSLDGLFSQSSFGIVTEMTFEVMPRPDAISVFALSIREPTSLGPVVTLFRELKLAGVIQSTLHIANAGRAVGKVKSSLVGVWNASGALYGPAEIVRAKRQVLRRALRKGLTRYRLVLLSRWLMALAAWIDRHLVRIPVLATLRDVVDLHVGQPTDHPLAVLMDGDESTQPVTATTSALDFNQHFRWINAVVPAEAEKAELAVDVLRDLFDSAGYEFRVTLTFVNARSLVLIANITFEKDPAAVAKAADFYTTCMNRLKAHGFRPYRSGSGMYGSVTERDPAFAALLVSLKRAIDPQGILSPGKYGI